MSIIGEMWEESDWERDKQLNDFLVILQEAAKQETKEGEEAQYWMEKYKQHFNL